MTLVYIAYGALLGLAVGYQFGKGAGIREALKLIRKSFPSSGGDP